MMRLSVLSRAAWRHTGAQLAASVGRKSSIATAMNKTKTAKKRSASSRVTSRRGRASPARLNESMTGAAGSRVVVAPPDVATTDVARTNAHVTSLHKLSNTTNLASSAVHLARGERKTRVSSLDSHASASFPPPSPPLRPSSALPTSSPPPMPHVNGCNVSVATLQRRIRSLLAQLVLLSPEPLRPSALFARYRDAVDEETANMCAWAAHAVYRYDHGLLHCGTNGASHAACRGVLSEGEAGARDVERQTAGTTEDNANSGSSCGGGAAVEQRVLWRRGQQLSQAFRTSVVPLVTALGRGGGSGGTEMSVAPRLPASHEVEQWMFLSIIFSDPEFRVSPYSGAVSYPALPSMLLATVNPLRDREVAKLCYALQWGVQAKAAAYAAFCETRDTSGMKYLSGTAIRKHEQQSPVPSATAREEVADTCEFVWLNGAAGSPTWTTAHAQYLLHSALAGVRKPSDESATRSVAPTTGFSADQQLRKTISAAARQQHTSGHPLVDVMLHASSVVGVATRGGGSQTSEANVFMNSGGTAVGTTRGSAAAAAQPPALGWNEGKKGTDVATSFAADTSEDGLFAVMMGDLPTRSLSAGAMYEINRRLIAHLFRKFTAIPIPVARLSTAVRWNLSVAHAAQFRSFLYFLLLTSANPMVHRMAEGQRHRRRANALCADVWGRKRGYDGEARGGVEDEVRNALAQYDPRTFKCLQDSGTAEGSTVAALRRAFVADAEVTEKCEHAPTTVMETMCVRVLPHARPGQWRTAPRSPTCGAAAEASVSPAFCGYPLRFIEVLPTWRQTPEEVLQYLWRQQDQAQLCSKDASWLENEEPYILVFSLDRGVLDTRLRLVIDRYLDLRNGAAASTVPPNRATLARVTLRQLGVITLWAHEYGAEMAAELLFVHLLPRHEEVRLHPPMESGHKLWGEETHKQTITTSGDETNSGSGSGYGAWTVEFLPH
nr:unnamed protein product [Leishmania braziliensis]